MSYGSVRQIHICWLGGPDPARQWQISVCRADFKKRLDSSDTFIGSALQVAAKLRTVTSAAIVEKA